MIIDFLNSSKNPVNDIQLIMQLMPFIHDIQKSIHKKGKMGKNDHLIILLAL